ncbi:MAG: DNA alkylation repair protein [Bacilli bacterium]|nr:DNA alkylation repair protein [Bacilli bacterium]
MNYSELEKHLFEICDKKFAKFSKTLSNSSYIAIGVKNPVLRQLIKEEKTDLELKIEDFRLGKYLEIDFIYFGLALSRANNVDEQLNFLERNIKKAKSWAITDCVVTYLKKTDFDKFVSFFKKLYRSRHTFDRRFCYVLALKHSKNPRILDIFPFLTLNEEYMVMMAEAWLLATIAIDFPDDVFKFLQSINDNILVRKTVSKVNDSFRVKPEIKERFKTLR